MLVGASAVLDKLDQPEELDFLLWTVVLCAMLADISLTLYGLGVGFIETNPIALFGLETVGYAVLSFLKAPALLVGVIGWVVLPTPLYRLNLIGLALPWLVVSLFNLWLIVGVGP